MAASSPAGLPRPRHAEVEFANIVDAVGCAARQRGMISRNAVERHEQAELFRSPYGHQCPLDTMVDGADIPGASARHIGCTANPTQRGSVRHHERGMRHLRAAPTSRIATSLELAFADLGEQTVKNIARSIVSPPHVRGAAGSAPCRRQVPDNGSVGLRPPYRSASAASSTSKRADRLRLHWRRRHRWYSGSWMAAGSKDLESAGSGAISWRDRGTPLIRPDARGGLSDREIDDIADRPRLSFTIWKLSWMLLAVRAGRRRSATSPKGAPYR